MEPFARPLGARVGAPFPFGVPCVEERKNSGEDDGTFAFEARTGSGVPFDCACDDDWRGAGDDMVATRRRLCGNV